MADAPKDFIYDQIAYPSPATPELTPGRIAASAAFFGFEAPDPQRPRMLEIGCGDGINLLALACAAPAGTYEGFDLSERAIARGQDFIRASGLDAVRLAQGDICDWPLDGGKFDIIVAHGVYAWVPGPVREALMKLIAARLAPGGIAYVSYDSNPCAAPKHALNEVFRAMIPHTLPAKEQADALIELTSLLLAGQTPSSHLAGYLRWLKENLSSYDADYIVHDHLAEFYQPISLLGFAKAAKAAGLGVLGDSDLTDLFDSDLPKDMRDVLRGFADDYVRYSVLLDTVRGIRKFRRTLLFRADAPPGRIDPLAAMDRMWFRCRGMRTKLDDGGDAFLLEEKGGRSMMRLADESERRIVDALHDELPGETTIAALAARLPDLPLDKIKTIVRASVVLCLTDATMLKPAYTLDPGPKPRASAYARAAARLDRAVVTLTHGRVDLPNMESRRFIELCDGTRDYAALAAEMSAILSHKVGEDLIAEEIPKLAALRIFPL